MAVVERVVDGDTFALEGGEKVRLTGIDTPELHHPTKPRGFYAEEARQAAQSLVEGRSVALVYDRDERDRYGRLLAYVLVGDVFVNARLLREGYARVMTVPPNAAMEPLFKEMEAEARAHGRGIWSKQTTEE